MRVVLAILLVLALTTARAQPSLYVVGWGSALPVRIERIEVRGGALVQVLTAGDGLSGTIAASAERECVTVTVDGVTTTGAGVRIVRTWDAGCERIFLPLVG